MTPRSGCPPPDKDPGSGPGCRLRHLLCELRKGVFPLGAPQCERMEVSSGERGGLQRQSGEWKGAEEVTGPPQLITGAHGRCSPLVVAAGECGDVCRCERTHLLQRAKPSIQ